MDELWRELNGVAVHRLSVGPKTEYQSMSKTHTFSPSMDKEFIYAQLIRNLESACAKARAYKFVAKRVSFHLKTQTFNYSGLDFNLTRASAIPQELAHLIRPHYDKIFKPGVLYRATGIALSNLLPADSVQRSLFEPKLQIDKMSNLYRSIDQVNSKYDHKVLHLFSSSQARYNDHNN
ncbi:hypothetical protein HY224_01805 [Candidatus Uhrbacteria bacterium]|nr:hypothetical protein [Candidatus Uhrbacteria bacterium]